MRYNATPSALAVSKAPPARSGCAAMVLDRPYVPVLCKPPGGRCGPSVIGFAPPLHPCGGVRALYGESGGGGGGPSLVDPGAITPTMISPGDDLMSAAQSAGLLPVILDPGFMDVDDVIPAITPEQQAAARERQRARQARLREQRRNRAARRRAQRVSRRQRQRRRGRQQPLPRPRDPQVIAARRRRRGLRGFDDFDLLGCLGCDCVGLDGFDDLDLADFEMVEYAAEQLGEYGEPADSDDWYDLGAYILPDFSNLPFTSPALSNALQTMPNWPAAMSPIVQPWYGYNYGGAGSGATGLTLPSVSIAQQQHAANVSQTTPRANSGVGFLDLVAAGAGLAAGIFGGKDDDDGGGRAFQVQTPGGQNAIVIRQLMAQQREAARQSRVAENEKRRQQRDQERAQRRAGGMMNLGPLGLPLLIGGGVLAGVMLLRKR